MDTFRKNVAHPDQAGAEAAGLRWLAQASPAVAEVVQVGQDFISTRRIQEVAPTPAAAREFGRELARVHSAGAPAFGAPPAGWEGKNYIGRIEQPCIPTARWGEFYVDQRVLPCARAAGLADAQLAAVERACELIAARDWDVQPARIHGDLWAGNVLFGAEGAVMIDPAAHGGHPHTDLGMLALFGAPYFEEMIHGYGAPADIERWIPMHQLHPLAVHAHTHGRAYHRPLAEAARATIAALER